MNKLERDRDFGHLCIFVSSKIVMRAASGSACVRKVILANSYHPSHQASINKYNTPSNQFAVHDLASIMLTRIRHIKHRLVV